MSPPADPLDPLVVASALCATVPAGSTVFVGTGASDVLHAALHEQGCVVGGATPTGVDAVLLAEPVPDVAGLATSIAHAADVLGAAGRVVGLLRSPAHAANRPLLDAPLPAVPQPEALGSALAGAGLHLWGLAPVRVGVVAGSGVDPTSITPEVVAAVDEDPAAGVAGFVVVAGRTPAPVEWATALLLGAELDRAWTALHAAHAAATDDAAGRLAEMRAQLDELGRQLDRTRADLASARADAAEAAERIVGLEQRWLSTQRGAARLGLAVDAWMLRHPRLRRVHARLGSLARRLRPPV